jgi:hypothetical protein
MVAARVCAQKKTVCSGLYHCMLVFKQRLKLSQKDDCLLGAGDGTRTRGNLLGRQMVAGSPLASYELALEERSYIFTVIHAHLRQIVACILRQMVMDQMHWKEYTSHLLERQERQMVNHPETKRCPSLSCSLTAIGNPSNPHGLATRSSMQELEGERPQNLLSVVETALNRNRE